MSYLTPVYLSILLDSSTQKPARFALNWSTVEPWVASGGEDKLVCLWNLGAHVTRLTGPAATSSTTSPQLAAAFTLKGHEETVEDVCFRPGSKDVLASVGDDRLLAFWDTRTGTRPVASVKKAHAGDIQGLDWSRADASLLATGDQHGVLKVWDVRALAASQTEGAVVKEVATITLDRDEEEDESAAITRVEWCPKRRDLLACCTDGGQATVYTLGSTAQNKQTLRPVFRHLYHDAGVEDLHWNSHVDSSEALLASCSEQEQGSGGGSLQVWRINDLITMPEEDAVKVLDQEFAFVAGEGAGHGQRRKDAEMT